jgi:hypothetical protein
MGACLKISRVSPMEITFINQPALDTTTIAGLTNRPFKVYPF